LAPCQQCRLWQKIMQGSDLNLAFGTEVIYQDANFRLQIGDKVGIVGVNGAGKTTLFKVILGLEKLDSGEITFPPSATAVGYVPQEIKIPELASDMTVWDYIYAARPFDALQEQLGAEYEKLAKYPNSTAILERINIIQEQIDACDIANADNDLLRIIEKMHLEDLTDSRMSELSGGQKSKVAFARALFEKASLLLLDEPTNHLDFKTRDFVMNYLRNYDGTVLVISHDQKFLDAVTNKTLFLNKTTHKTKVYKGNYTAFRKQYAADLAAEDAKITEQEREIKRLQEFVMRARNAKRSNTALIGMGHQREKVLAKRLEELGTREKEYQKVSINVEPKSKSGTYPLELQNLTFHYEDCDNLYENLSFRLSRGEKFLVVGENGIGKSTLLKLIVGQLQPISGNIILGHNTDIAYYAQELEILDERRTVFENVSTYDYTDTELRGILSNFLFEGEDINKKVSVLSPGEKARVALCKILLKRANLVILDEPTNHFDPDTQRIIGENFKDYSGTLIMVSHNPDFVEQVGINRMLVLPDGIIKNYSHELLEYYYYLNSDLI